MKTMRNLPSLVQECKDLLARLISFPTVSDSSNLSCANFIQSYLRSHNIESVLIPDRTGDKAALFATIGPRCKGGVVLSGHMDVVPPGGGWSRDPWTLHESSGLLFGRGTTDMKGFIAAALCCVPLFKSERIGVPIHLAFSYDEEVGCKGVAPLIDAMMPEVEAPSAVVVGEPTNMRVVSGHKSCHSFITEVHGHSVHSSRLDKGVSAIAAAAQLISWLDATMQGNPRVSNGFDPPYSTLHCGTIVGGTAANVVASLCSFTTDVRCIPEEAARDFRARFEEHARLTMERSSADVDKRGWVSFVERSDVPSLVPDLGSSAELLIRSIVEDQEPEFVSYATEGGFFQAAGWPTVVCGPGNIEQAHTKDEFLSLDQLQRSVEFNLALIERLKLMA